MTAPYHLGIVLSIAAATHARLAEAGALDEDGAALLAEAPDVETVLVRMLRAKRGAQLDVEKLEKWIGELQIRKQRFENKHDECKRAAAAIMAEAGIATFRHAEFTASLSRGQPGVVVTDEAALPERFVRVERKPNLAALREAMADGEVVPGVEWANGAPQLTVRTK